jgi:2,4-dienoyl-CoA reductase-like NADH-dependent reductase (Old Yellow Enzyme family)
LIPGGHGSNASTPTISRTPEWAEVVRGIARGGTLPGIQLTTAWEGYAGSRNFRSSTPREIIRRSREVVHRLGPTGIASTLRALDAADIAMEAGFRHLQVHAAHGYLFSLLVDDRLNEHASEVLERLTGWAVRQSTAGIETSIRISLRTGDGDFDEDGGDNLHPQVARLPFDFVDVSSGFYNIDKRRGASSQLPSESGPHSSASQSRTPSRLDVLKIAVSGTWPTAQKERSIK